MAISRCNKCGIVSEHAPDLVGTVGLCATCGSSNSIHDTVFYLTNVLSRFMAQQKELNSLKALHINDASVSLAVSEDVGGFDIHNSDVLTSEIQHSAISKWFRDRQISININSSAVDTTGFFDEAAVEIGRQFDILGEVIDRIRYAQQKGYDTASINLDKKNEVESKLLTRFCKQLYQYSLVAKVLNNREEQNIRVVLQAAPSVRKFFSGEWLEWFSLMEGLKTFRNRKVMFSCARNLALTLPGGDKYELDVFFLLNGTDPLYIECKTGEYRQDLEKYVALRKKLGISSRKFVMCIAGLDHEQAKGLSAMYGLTFVGEDELVPHLETLC